MRKRRIQELAKFIESGKYSFNMSVAEADPECGTAGCIGGHAAVIWPEVRDVGSGLPWPSFTFDGPKLAEFLDISEPDLNDICFNVPASSSRVAQISYEEVTSSMAAATLRRFAETGRVYFSRRDA